MYGWREEQREREREVVKGWRGGRRREREGDREDEGDREGETEERGREQKEKKNRQHFNCFFKKWR